MAGFELYWLELDVCPAEMPVGGIDTERY